MLRPWPARSRPAPPKGASAGPAWGFVACGAVAVAMYAVGPPTLGMALFLLIAVGSIAATAIGTRRQPDRSMRRPWWGIVGAVGCFFGATVVRLVVPGADPTDPPSLNSFVPDLLVVPGYLLLGYSLLTMLGRRRASDDDPAKADALLIGLGAALATWAFLIAPRFGTHVPSTATLAVAFFPMADVVLLVMVSRLMLADGVRQPSLWLLGIAMSGMFVGDLFYSVVVDGLSPSATSLMVVDVSFLCAYVAIGGAVLHPTMRTLTEPHPVVVRILGPLRTAGIAALLIAPTVLATLAPAPTRWNGLVRLAITTLLTITVIARIVSSNNSRARAEQVARRAEQAARHRATHDSLTELPNRELLSDTITSWCDRAAAEGQEISLLFLDLDRFKIVNDRWGHAVGDELLCAVASRLSAMVRSEDLVCRIGADEFVIAMASASHTALAESLATRLLEEFARPFTLSTGGLIITPSIGIARSSGAIEALDLIRDADTAMYKAKGSGRNGYAVFAEPLREQIRRRADLEQALRGALTYGELSIHYQPIIDLPTDELAGFEALMRWNHPELGMVSPLEFIPIAEDTGLIVTAGAWLLEEAATQLAQWRTERPSGARPLHMSVNISVRQLRNSELVGVVRGVLARTGLPASALWLEITESGVIEDPEASLATLRELRALGVTLCIDDFGTGYSSLTYLKQFPASIVKIDRSFVSGVGDSTDDEAIVRTVVAMAHALGQQVVAEGVETVKQRDWLRELQCDLVQGYLYGAPRPAAAQRSWITGPTTGPTTAPTTTGATTTEQPAVPVIAAR